MTNEANNDLREEPSNEYDKVREECRLTDKEMVDIVSPVTDPTIIEEVNNNAESRAIFCSEYSAIASATLNKVLNHPSILIKDPDQELPKVGFSWCQPDCAMCVSHRQTQKNMINTNYVRVLPKEQK